MVNLQKAEEMLIQNLEVKLMSEDMDRWIECLRAVPHGKYVPLTYKPSFIEYQAAYFSDVYDEYRDISLVLYRGGKRVGIWPLCLYKKEEKIYFGSLGGYIAEPLFVDLPKAEAQRNVIQKILKVLVTIIESSKDFNDVLLSQIMIMDDGLNQWQRKWMEEGATCRKVTWQAFADLSLGWDEIQSKMRRTNKYSVAKGQEDYDIEIYDSDTDALSNVFREFHEMHRRISGRETRSARTWELQEKSIRDNNEQVGFDFVIFIRDKVTKELAGSALFATTPRTGLYCVAAYDRERFSRPVGHIVQVVAMDYMKNKGIRWYEIGERTYPGDEGSNQKLINIGSYKEGFATHIYPKIVMQLNTVR